MPIAHSAVKRQVPEVRKGDNQRGGFGLWALTKGQDLAGGDERKGVHWAGGAGGGVYLSKSSSSSFSSAISPAVL